MCALAEGNWLPGASSRLEARSPSYAGRSDGRGEDRGSPVELSRATRLSRLARPMSDQGHFVALLYTLSRDTTQDNLMIINHFDVLEQFPHDTNLHRHRVGAHVALQGMHHV